jgi:hypothetical protein
MCCRSSGYSVEATLRHMWEPRSTLMSIDSLSLFNLSAYVMVRELMHVRVRLFRLF